MPRCIAGVGLLTMVCFVLGCTISLRNEPGDEDSRGSETTVGDAPASDITVRHPVAADAPSKRTTSGDPVAGEAGTVDAGTTHDLASAQVSRDDVVTEGADMADNQTGAEGESVEPQSDRQVDLLPDSQSASPTPAEAGSTREPTTATSAATERRRPSRTLSDPSKGDQPDRAPAQPRVFNPDVNVRLDLTFDDIKFDMEKGAPWDRKLLTDQINQLASRKIRIRGYILPGFQERGITQFVLVRDNMECCFGPGAALYDCILVTMKSGKSTDYTVRPVTVDGEFEIEPFEGPDGYPLAIYRMQGEQVD